MGGPKGRDPYSIFVGLHALWLLSQKKEWRAVREDLERIGYTSEQVVECETWLRRKEVLKKVGAYWHVETAIVSGHWELLAQGAYTDNMAIVCAGEWNLEEKAPESDPLDPEDLPRRVNASIWFVGELWAAEKATRAYPPANRNYDQRWTGGYTEFLENRKGLRIPSIVKGIAIGYLGRMKTFSVWRSTRHVLPAT